MLKGDYNSGVMLADYHVVRQHKLKLNELYVGNSSSIYWFRSGFNWRAFAAFTAGMWPLLRTYRTAHLRGKRSNIHIAGLVATVNAYTDAKWTGWIRLYNLTFLVGVAISFSVFIGLCYLFPVPGLGLETPFVEDEVIDGQSTPLDTDSKVEEQATGKV